jgi:uncharacterized protein (DUF58 family)
LVRKSEFTLRRVESKPWREYFSSGRLENNASTEGWYFYRLRHLFNPSALATLLFVMFLLTSAFSRTSRIAAATFFTYGAYVYLRTKATAEGLFIRRIIKRSFFSEFDEVEVTIEITNASSFSIPPGLIIEDRFDLSLDSEIHLVEGRAIAPESRIHLTYKRTCDAGMGAHQVGPLYARVTDLQNLLEFRVYEDTIEQLQVYPHVAAITQPPLVGTPDSASYGVYEVATRGTSVNFAGVRPYTSGDSVRQIAWRVSAKRPDGLMVKEFEKIANCDVTIILNLDPHLHVGYKSRSTWEAAKDAVLSIVSGQIEIGNSVQLISNDFYIEPSRGEDHFEFMCRTLMSITPKELGSEQKPSDLLNQFLPFLPSGSAVFYVTPFDEHENGISRAPLLMLRANGVQVYCIYVDASTYLQRLHGANTISQMASITKSSIKLQAAAMDLELHGIKTYLIRDETDIQNLFLNSTRGRNRSETKRPS